MPPLEAATPVAGYLQLLEACLDVMRKPRAPSDPAYRPRHRVEWTPSQAMARIRSMLDQDPRGLDLLGCLPTLPAGLPDRAATLRAAIASTLAAGLELARVGQAPSSGSGVRTDREMTGGGPSRNPPLVLTAFIQAPLR